MDTNQKKGSTPTEYMIADELTIGAAKEYLLRKSRQTHPEGDFDNGGRWYPSEDEIAVCCSSVRSPSRSYPYSLLTHCRSAAHIANSWGVDSLSVKRAAKALEKADSCHIELHIGQL